MWPDASCVCSRPDTDAHNNARERTSRLAILPTRIGCTVGDTPLSVSSWIVLIRGIIRAVKDNTVL